MPCGACSVSARTVATCRRPAPDGAAGAGRAAAQHIFCHLLSLVALLGATRHPRTSSCWCFAMRSPCPAAPTLGHAWTGPTARSLPHCSTAADEGARPSPSPGHTIRRRHRRLDADGPGSSRKRSPRTGEDDPLCVIKDRRGGRGRRGRGIVVRQPEHIYHEGAPWVECCSRSW